MGNPLLILVQSGEIGHLGHLLVEVRRVQLAAEDNLIEVNESSYTLTDPTLDFPYTVKVRAIENGFISEWSQPSNFMVPSGQTFIGSDHAEWNESMPCGHTRAYTLNQQIYLASELGSAGNILSIGYYMKNTGTVNITRNLDIYMAHTNLDHYTSGSDYIPVTNANRVFRGTVTFTNNGWTTITLDTPFAYDGHSNVAITVDDNTGQPTTYEHCAYYLRFHTDGDSTFDASYGPGCYGCINLNPFSSNQDYVVRNWKNQIRVCFSDSKTHIANTASESAMTWEQFANEVNSGHTFAGKTIYLDEDITATTRAGYESASDTKSFQGTFDGLGHTITFNFTANSVYAAPFACVKNATFLNLKTAGTITANTKRYAGGIAGMVISGSQNCTFTNCESNVTITSTSNGTDDCRHGGFVANVVGGNVTFNGCAFTGGFSGTNAKGWGGFVGYFNHYVYFTDCIFSPTSISINNQNNYTFARPSGTQVITFTNCYYTQSLGGSQGKQMHYVSGVNSVIVSMAGEPTHYSVSGITAYSGNQGLNYYGVRAGVGDVVLLNLSGGNTYTFSHGGGTLTGDSNPYTLTMPDNDVGIIAESYFPLPFVNDFENGCDMFLYNGGKPDCWCWGTAASHGGTHGLYISNDGGATNNYNNMVNESVYAVKPLHFERGAYDISYDWRSNGGYLRVALAPKWLKFDGVFNINWTNEWVALDGGSSLNNSTEWQTVHQTIEFDAPVDCQLVFIWNNYGVQDINNPPAAIDNVSVMSVSCNKPYDLQCTGFTGTTATLSWTENGDATAWQICLNGDESNLVEANSNPFTLTNLTPEIQYTAKVRANCGDEQSSWSNTISFSPSFKVVIGSGMNPSGELPTDNELDYDLTQQIYTTGELGDAGVFMSIDFFRVSGQFPQASCARNLDIYMTHTDKNVYESNSDWVNVTNADLVFSGTVDFAKDVWTTITLDTPFEYDGQHNVIITVDDNTGSHDDRAQFMTFVPYQLQSLGIDSWEITNNFNYDPATYSGSGSLYYDKTIYE